MGKQQRRRITPKLHVRLALVDASVVRRRRTLLVSADTADKFDNSTLAVDCSNEEFRSIEASLYQLLHRTTANEPLRIVQQTRGQEGFEAWHAIVRRCEQRNMSDKSAYAALISTISERDRAKDVEQFDEMLKTSTRRTKSRTDSARSETRKRCSQSRILMPESLLNYRFRRADDVVQQTPRRAGEPHQ